MNDKQLLCAIENIKPEMYDNYGLMVDFSSIYAYLEDRHGLTNKDLLESKLKEFDKQGLLKVVYMKDFGFEDLMIGVKLNVFE